MFTKQRFLHMKAPDVHPVNMNAMQSSQPASSRYNGRDMIQDRIEKIETTLRNSPNLAAETRDELLQLIDDLKAEVTPLVQSHCDDVQSIARFADASVHEATRSEQKPALFEAALKGLSRSVQGFEASHPKLVQAVDRLALTLSNMGI